MLEILQVISIMLQTAAVVLLAVLVHMTARPREYKKFESRGFDYGGKEREPDPAAYKQVANQPKAATKIEVPQIDPAIIAKNLKRPPRPPGGFGAVVSDENGQRNEDSNSQ